MFLFRDVLPFPLELPDAIARASSHKELESISHMGIGWSFHFSLIEDFVSMLKFKYFDLPGFI